MSPAPDPSTIWARASSDEQETSNQIAELRAWGAQRGQAVTAKRGVG